VSETPPDAHPRRIDCVLICGGVWHDIDFARLELLKLLADDPAVRTRVFEDYENIAAIEAADILITYTCDITPSLPAQEALKAWLARGGRWYALHGTNSVLRLLSDGPNAGLWDAPRWAPLFMDLLGSQFISHPPIAPYRVEVADPDHPLVQGWKRSRPRTSSITSKPTAISTLLLDTCCRAGHRLPRRPPAAIRCSIKHHGAGAVLYLTLGHCRGHYDLQPLLDWWPSVDRCAWDLPVFHDLLRRGVAWLKEPLGE
jgi:hypothetical protein